MTKPWERKISNIQRRRSIIGTISMQLVVDFSIVPRPAAKSKVQTIVCQKRPRVQGGVLRIHQCAPSLGALEVEMTAVD
jgi:hypothetical protein